MDLYSSLRAEHRERLDAAAVRLRLGRGATLMRRGERGGDVYRVVEGRLEVIDTSSDPPIVLDHVGEGAFIGEMAFLDERVRSADVRAAEETVCQHWARDRLLALLDEQPALGMDFFRALSMLINERSREFRQRAVQEGLRAGGPTAGGAEGAEGPLLSGLLAQLAELEILARGDRAATWARLPGALESFGAQLLALVERQESRSRALILERCAQALHPWLSRAQTGRLCIERPEGQVSGPLLLQHLGDGQPSGDGALGELLDQWLLGCPTPEALASRQRALRAALEAAPGRRVLVLGGAASGLAAHLCARLPASSSLRLVEDRREALGALVANGCQPRLAMYQDDLVALALGEGTLNLGAHDQVVVDGLLDHLPDRAAARLLGELRRACAPKGRLWLSALAPPAPADQAEALVMRHILRWPLVRRGPEVLEVLLQSAGFAEVRAQACARGGLLVEARA